MKTLLQYCDELELNIVAKRHSSTGKWDIRVSHPWLHNPILSTTGKDTYEDGMADLNGRVGAIENMRVGIERKNEQRRKKAEQGRRNYKDDTDQWYERF